MKTSLEGISEHQARFILDSIPASRRQTYLEIAGKNQNGNLDVLAARLYVWNGYLASVVDRTTGEVEVLLRNFMDEAFSSWNSRATSNGSPEWLVHPEGILAELIKPPGRKPLVDYAELSPSVDTPSHDDYVAGLTFGNWVHLLPKPHAGENNKRVQLWKQALEPSLDGANHLNRVSFQIHAMRAKEMRNRATHRRPLIKKVSDLQLTHQSCVELARAINPDMGEWLRDQKWIPLALQKSPLK